MLLDLEQFSCSVEFMIVNHIIDERRCEGLTRPRLLTYFKGLKTANCGLHTSILTSPQKNDQL